jgi:hypothetical protein
MWIVCERSCSSFPLVILRDPRPSTTLPSVSETDSTGEMFCLTWMRPLTSIELHLLSILWFIQIDLHLSATLPSLSETDSSRRVSYLTWMRPLTSIELHLLSILVTQRLMRRADTFLLHVLQCAKPGTCHSQAVQHRKP